MSALAKSASESRRLTDLKTMNVSVSPLAIRRRVPFPLTLASHRGLAVVFAVVACGFGTFPAVLDAREPEEAPPLKPPRGRTIAVGTVGQLYRAVYGATSGTTIVVKPGTYRLDRPLHFGVQGPRRNLTLRGATRRPEDVMLRGPGMDKGGVPHGVYATNVDGLLIAYVSIGHVRNHAIQIGATTDRLAVYRCRLVDTGEQFIKCSAPPQGVGSSDNGSVKYNIIEYTKEGPANGYTNGVDVHRGRNWHIAHNVFRNIRTPKGARYKAVPSVLMWNDTRDTICEGNTFINCDLGIAFGLAAKAKNGQPDHQGGVIRNNFIVRMAGEVVHADTGIFVASPRTKVLHNTVLLRQTFANAIEVRWPETNEVLVANNLSDGAIRPRDNAQLTAKGNRTDAKPAWFVGATDGDLHLAPTLDTTLNRLPAEEDCTDDWDGERRDGSHESGETVLPGADMPSKNKKGKKSGGTQKK